MKPFFSVPEWAKSPLRRARDVIRAVPYYGTARLCCVCGRASRKFRAGGRVPRTDAMCVHCGALERHRLVWLYFKRRTNLFDGAAKRVLHVAPERCFESRLREQLGDGYVTADLTNPRAMLRMDITDIQYPDESFDVIYCSHVLEHVADDKQAMREFHRVLKRGGWAVLLVPVTADVTFEDPSIVEPQERLRAFGQEDHVRRYGPDYADRLRDAGFTVTVTGVAELAEGDNRVVMGLTRAAGEVFYCTK